MFLSKSKERQTVYDLKNCISQHFLCIFFVYLFFLRNITFVHISRVLFSRVFSFSKSTKIRENMYSQKLVRLRHIYHQYYVMLVTL